MYEYVKNKYSSIDRFRANVQPKIATPKVLSAVVAYCITLPVTQYTRDDRILYHRRKVMRHEVGWTPAIQHVSLSS